MGPLQCRHNGRHGITNHQPHDCFLDRSFRRIWWRHHAKCHHGHPANTCQIECVLLIKCQFPDHRVLPLSISSRCRASASSCTLGLSTWLLCVFLECVLFYLGFVFGSIDWLNLRQSYLIVTQENMARKLHSIKITLEIMQDFAGHFEWGYLRKIYNLIINNAMHNPHIFFFIGFPSWYHLFIVVVEFSNISCCSH